MPGCLIIATGPSLTIDDINRWSHRRTVYAVNDAYKLCLPDVLYACDCEWWDVHEPLTRHIDQRWTTSDDAAVKYGLRHIPGQHADQCQCYFDVTGDGIIYGGNSGFQTLNLAFAHGQRDALLLGFDMEHATGEPKHFFGDHPSHIDRPSPYRAWLEHWQHAAPVIAAAGMIVRNATRGGALNVFPRA